PPGLTARRDPPRAAGPPSPDRPGPARFCLTSTIPACVRLGTFLRRVRDEYGQASRVDRLRVGGDRALAARAQPGTTLEGPPPGDQWHPLGSRHRRCLAGCTRKIRSLADALRPLRTLDA